VHDDIVDVTFDDSGPGVPVADRQRVFDRFSHVGDVMTGKPRGTGLGLSITQRILHALDGTIWCEGSPLGGARFRVVLPNSTAVAAAH
jgi:signal transduction histidine kinase